uniref:hypothetical protein n=1 Tax=Nocardia brasiliensis TaxID=37326 RepID=UPI0024558E08
MSPRRGTTSRRARPAGCQRLLALPGVLSLADLQATVDQRTGRTDIRLHEPEWISMWRANIRLADHYRTGNT